MTEQDFESELDSLKGAAEQYKINFRIMLCRDAERGCDGELQKSNASEHKDTVYLTLVKSDDFADWVSALNKSRNIVNEILRRREWEQTNPNIFERLQFKYGTPNKCM